jgi:hypothetical protein
VVKQPGPAYGLCDHPGRLPGRTTAGQIFVISRIHGHQ